MTRRLAAACFVLSALASCGIDAPPVDDPPVSTAESESIVCGTALSCPDGEHVANRTCHSSCSRYGCNLPIGNAVNCVPNTPSFSQCGLDCPGGYHATQYFASSACGYSTGNANAAWCVANTGPGFQQCGIYCPGGYHPTSWSATGQCGYSTGNINSAWCSVDTSAFTQCGRDCPGGYRTLSRFCSGQCSYCNPTNAAHCAL